LTTFPYFDNLRLRATIPIRKHLARPDSELVTLSIDVVKDLHPELTFHILPSLYLKLISKPSSEGGLWGDYFIAKYVALVLKRPKSCLLQYQYFSQ
jgi:hypothetical protein